MIKNIRFTLKNIKTIIFLLFEFKVSVFDFKMLTWYIEDLNNHKIFEFFIKIYDVNLDLSYCDQAIKKSHLKEGRSSDTIKPYRVLTFDHMTIFEKIYFNYSSYIQPVLYLNKNKKSIFTNKLIIVPEIYKVIIGDKFTIVLFEYVKLESLPKGREYEILKQYTIELCKGLPTTAPAHKIRSEKLDIGKQKMLDENILNVDEIHKIQILVESCPIYFQHLDLSANNVFLNNIIVDWDNSGNYPLGIDFGRLLLSFLIYNSDDFVSSYKGEIYNYYINNNYRVNYTHFHMVVVYHFIIFYYGHFPDLEHLQIVLLVVKDFKHDINNYELNMRFLQEETKNL